MDSTASARASRSPRLPVLINRNFTFLWTGGAVSSIGDYLFDTTLVLWVATAVAAGKSWVPMAVTGVLIAASLPMLVVGPLAGVFTDRWNKRRTMLTADALRAVLVASLLPLTYLPDLPVFVRLGAIYAVVLLASVCSQFFIPARTSLISDIVEEGDQRTRASGLAQMSTHFSMLIGPPLAGPLFITLGPAVALGVNALSFVVSFLTIAAVRPEHTTRSLAPGVDGNARAEFLTGIRFFARSHVLVTVLLSLLIVMLGAGSLNALDYFFIRGNLHGGNAIFGFVTAAEAAGALVGAILTTVLVKKLSPTRMFTGGLLLTGIGLLVYSRMTAVGPGVAVLFLTGMPIAALNVALMPLVFQATPQEMLGRVSSVINPAVALVSLISMAVSGYLVSTVLRTFHAVLFGMTIGPVDLVFSLTGLLTIVAAVYAIVGLRSAGDTALVGAGDAAGEAIA